MRKIGPALTWNELADAYDKINPSGRYARTLPMDSIIEWVERHLDVFYIDPEEKTIHQIQNNDGAQENQTRDDS